MSDPTPRPGRRVVLLDPDDLAQLLTQPAARVTLQFSDPLPADARLVNAGFADFDFAFVLLFESAAWPPTAEGCQHERLALTFARQPAPAPDERHTATDLCIDYESLHGLLARSQSRPADAAEDGVKQG